MLLVGLVHVSIQLAYANNHAYTWQPGTIIHESVDSGQNSPVAEHDEVEEKDGEVDGHWPHDETQYTAKEVLGQYTLQKIRKEIAGSFTGSQTLVHCTIHVQFPSCVNLS